MVVYTFTPLKATNVDKNMTLREWLFKQKISISFFCALIKIDRSYLYRLMTGKKKPSDKLMAKIREISLDQVYEQKDLLDAPIERSHQKNTE
jgi:transcriptional regulator with XRE-family HTH domain